MFSPRFGPVFVQGVPKGKPRTAPRLGKTVPRTEARNAGARDDASVGLQTTNLAPNSYYKTYVYPSPLLYCMISVGSAICATSFPRRLRRRCFSNGGFLALRQCAHVAHRAL